MSNAAGAVVTSAGDISGDGIAEVAIASTTQNTVYIIDGQQEGTYSLSEALVRIENMAGDGTVLSMSSLGDTNGDHIDDFAIGAPNGNLAYLFYGQLSGVIDANNASVIINGNGAEQLGYAISRAGDTNEDGLQDILIGARHNSTTANKSGAAYLFLGLGI